METPLEATKDEDEDEDEESVARAQECLLQALIAHTARELPRRELNQDWAVLGELGSGSYGRVVLAEPRDGGARVALKLLSKERTAKWGFLREFCTHLCLQGAFTCIQVLPLAFETPTEFGFAQELAPAGDLCSLLTPGVGLPEPQVKRCASQVSAALAYLHGHALVHRDLKLDNVLAFDPECHLVKLGDFGLTRVLGWQVRPAPGATPYAAPELWHLRASEARLRLEPTLDTWAFGVLLFALLTGSFPWASPARSDPAFRCFQAWHGRTCAGEVPPRPPRTWRGLGEAALGLLRGLLHPHPARRSPPGEVLRYLGRPWAGGAGQVSAEGEEGSGQVSAAGENGSRQGSSSGESGQVSSAGENGSGQGSSPGEGGSSQVSVAGEGGSGQGSSSGESESGQASSEGEGGSSQVSSAGEGEPVSPAGKSSQGSPSGESSQVSFSGESGQMSPEDEGWGSQVSSAGAEGQVSSAGNSGQVSSAGEGGSVQVSPAGESCQVSSTGEDGQGSSSGESSQVGPAGDSGSPSSEVETPGQVMETPEHGTETPGSGSGTPEDEIETPGQGMETPRSWIETHGKVVDTPGSELEVLGNGIEAPGQVGETPGTGLETPGVRRKHLEMG